MSGPALLPSTPYNSSSQRGFSQRQKEERHGELDISTSDDEWRSTCLCGWACRSARAESVTDALTLHLEEHRGA